jgi:hypothetical protein
MSQEFARLIITLVAVLLVGRQALRAAPGSRRRQSFSLAALGFALLTLGNAFPVLGLSSQVALTLLVGIGLALLLGSLVSLFFAYREGELADQFRRAGAMVAKEREQIAERERREREERERRS